MNIIVSQELRIVIFSKSFLQPSFAISRITKVDKKLPTITN